MGVLLRNKKQSTQPEILRKNDIERKHMFLKRRARPYYYRPEKIS